MRLDDLMRDELAHVHADADAVIARATTARRHRRLSWTASGVAAAMILGVGGWALVGHGTGNRAVDPADGATVPASPRVLAGALASALDDGSLGDLGTPTAWEAADASPNGYLASASWSDKSGDTEDVSLAIVHQSALGSLVGSGPEDAQQLARACSKPGAADPCDVTQLPAGDTLITFGDRAAPTAILSSPRRDLAVFATAETSAHSDRQMPSIAAFSTFVEQPWWGWQLPARFASVGASLNDYSQQRLDPSASPSTVVGSASAGPVEVASSAPPAP